MTALFDLSGRIALVTGSAQGLGHAIARGLGEAGATVVLNDIVADRLDAAVTRLTETAGDGVAEALRRSRDQGDAARQVEQRRHGRVPTGSAHIIRSPPGAGSVGALGLRGLSAPRA